MENSERKQHWEKIYQNNKINEVSWYQPSPEISLDFFQRFHLPLSANIIDVGGGDSFLVDQLLELGYRNISVLDISEKALENARIRLGEKAKNVKWINADASEFQPEEKYDFWHDRAAFHFLTQKNEITGYVNTVSNYINPGGYLVIGTFSVDGPTKCSGLEIQQYSEQSMTDLFTGSFDKIACKMVDHKTPSGNIQNFIFCSFRRRVDS